MSDAATVEQLRDASFRCGYLYETLLVVRDGMSWAASNLPPESRERQLLEGRIQRANRTLSLCDQADRCAGR